MPGSEVIIVGAGLAGLCCARVLTKAGVSATVLEASDDIGGRVRTDSVDGFLIDRGFQIFLTSYPEAQDVLDFDSLKLRGFYPGALVRTGGMFYRIADPRKKPLDAARGFLSPVATFADKACLAVLERRIKSGTLEDMWEHPEQSTIDTLNSSGFAESTIDRFFRPFFGGVFFDRGLHTSSRMFEFVFRMFSTGTASLPAGGMAEIPRQIAASLPNGSIRLGTPVSSATATSVTLESSETILTRAVVVAADMDNARRILRDDTIPSRGWRSTTTLSYAAPDSPISDPILVLDGDGTGPVNHLAVPSLIQPSYAPPGKHLVCATIVDQSLTPLPETELDSLSRTQLREWFGPSVDSWKLLRADHIPRALPEQPTGALTPPHRPSRTASDVFLAGDHLENASINGAMLSGRRAAEAVLKSLGRV